MRSKISKLLTLSADILIIILVVVSLVIMVKSAEGDLSGGGFSAFKYFTVDSNALLGLMALLTIPFDVMVLCGKMQKSPRFAKILIQSGQVGTTLTFLTVVFFLGFVYGHGNMFSGPNLFMHLLTPITGFARFVLLGKDEKPMRYIPDSFFGMMPMVIYGIAYFINVGVHNGYGDPDYDWYMFGALGPYLSPLMFLGMASLTYALSIAAIFAQKKMHKLIYKTI